jgi:hypothetical protein
MCDELHESAVADDNVNDTRPWLERSDDPCGHESVGINCLKILSAILLLLHLRVAIGRLSNTEPPFPGLAGASITEEFAVHEHEVILLKVGPLGTAQPLNARDPVWR